jgi:ArsR family transcriptional regulator
MSDLADILRGLADENRIIIIKALQQSALSVSEIVDILGIGQSSVSKHLSVLRDINIVDFRRLGKWSIYYLRQPEDPQARTILEFIRQWRRKDPQIEKMVNLIHEMIPHGAE